MFVGYSFVAPHLLRNQPVDPEPEQLIQEINLTDRPPEMNRPALRDVYKNQNKVAFLKFQLISQSLSFLLTFCCREILRSLRNI